ncbi:MAG: hypothetical protein V4651_08255 [Bacteroidota bacterium]
MFPFLTETQKLGITFQMQQEARINAMFKPFTPDELEAHEAKCREEMGDGYIEDRVATRAEFKAVIARIKSGAI